MPFDVDELFRFCVIAIQEFAAEHQDEDFYAFAFDDCLLCLNSEQEFAATLKECQTKWNYMYRPVEHWSDLTEDDLRREEFSLDLHLMARRLDRSNITACLEVINEVRARARARIPSDIKDLRENTGDWTYQGFADMIDSSGFDADAFDMHSQMSDQDKKSSDFRKAMETLIVALRNSNVFACLKTTPDSPLSGWSIENRSLDE